MQIYLYPSSLTISIIKNRLLFDINFIGDVVMYNPDKTCKVMINRIKKICDQKKMTPYTLAKEAGVSTSTVSYLLSGRTKPQVYTLLLLCNVLDVSISELFEYEGSNQFIDISETELQFITYEEKELLCKYRDFSYKKREMLKTYVEMLNQYRD